MTSKEIEDGADTTLIAELDDAAEARIIDVLSKVFVTNKYPGLRAALIDGIERHRQKKEMEEKQRQYEMFEKQRFIEQSKLQNAAQNTGYSQGMQEIFKQEMEKRKAAAAPPPSVYPFGKLIF